MSIAQSVKTFHFSILEPVRDDALDDDDPRSDAERLAAKAWLDEQDTIAATRPGV